MSDIQRSFGLRFLKYVGLHPKSNRTFSTVLAPFQIISAGFCFFLSCHQLFFGKRDVASLVKNVEACAAMIQAVAGLFLYRVYNEKLRDLMNGGPQMLSINEVSNVDLRRKYSKVLKIVIQFQTVYFYMSVVAAFFYISSPLLMNQVDLPFGTFNTDNIYLHHFAVVMQWVAISQAAFYCTSGTTIIYCGLCVNIIIQYKILKQNLLDLDYKDHAQLMTSFIKTVRHHIFLRKYTQVVSDFFSPYLLAVYVSEIFMICSNTYVLIENEVDLSIVIRMMIAYPILLTELAILSIIGQLVSDEEASLGNACYEAGWHETLCMQFRKTIVMVIAMTQKPRCLTALGFFIVNNGTFFAVLKVSWSILNLLRAQKTYN